MRHVKCSKVARSSQVYNPLQQLMKKNPDANNTVLYLELESRDTQGSNIEQSWEYLHHNCISYISSDIAARETANRCQDGYEETRTSNIPY